MSFDGRGEYQMEAIPNGFFDNQEDKFIFHLVRFIRHHNLSSGEKLPSIRDFSEEMDISQSQVRSGIMKASALGLVEMRSRSGCYVSHMDLTKLVSTFSLLFEASSMSSDHPLLELYELKTTLERGVLKRVAQVRTIEEMVELKRIIDSMDGAETQEEMIRIDEQFHSKLAQISRNSLYYSLINVIQAMLRENRLVYTDYVSEWKQSVEDHRIMFEAVKKQDTEAAAELAESLSNRRKDIIIEATLKNL